MKNRTIHRLCGFRVLLLALALAVSVGTGLAADGQERHSRKWWQSAEYVKKLRLSPEQVAQLEKVFEASLPELRASKAELDRQEAELSRLIAAPTTQESEVVRQIDAVERARSALGKARTLMLFRLHRLLTPEQLTKLKALHSHGNSVPRGDRRPGKSQ